MTTEVCIRFGQLVAICVCRNNVLTLHDEEQQIEIHGAGTGLRDLHLSSSLILTLREMKIAPDLGTIDVSVPKDVYKPTTSSMQF